MYRKILLAVAVMGTVSGVISQVSATPEAAGVQPGGRPPSNSTNGRRVQVNYMLECQGCHLPDGSGMAGRVPTLRGQVQHFLIVPGGREFLVQVPGSSNSKLSDRDLAELMDWILVQFGGLKPGSFKPYSAEEVAQYRKVKLGNVVATRAALAAGFPKAQ